LVDTPPEEPLERTAEEQVDAARRQSRLSRLRELALVLAADVVDHQLQSYLSRHGIRQQLGTHERVLVCITPRANVHDMIVMGRIIAERFHGELIVAYVNQPDISEADRTTLEEKLDLARAAGARIEILEGEDPVSAILEFAESKGITQLFIGHSQRSGIGTRLRGNPVDRLIERSSGMDVRVFPQ
jgi:two-component system sensor histidine kinase KdpD